MRLHELYSTSAGVKQVLLIEKLTLQELSKKVGINFEQCEEYQKGKKAFSTKDLNRFVGTFVYMKGRLL